MGRPRKSPNMSEGKQNIIQYLMQEYNIQSVEDIQEALKDLLGGTIQNMLEAELDDQLEEKLTEDPEYHDSRNGYKP